MDDQTRQTLPCGHWTHRLPLWHLPPDDCLTKRRRDRAQQVAIQEAYDAQRGEQEERS
jgi:hypothetical protein